MLTAAPLRLATLALRGLRNLHPVEFQPCPRFNVLYGDNGSGKSNLLEAVAYLALLRSFRGAPKEDIVQRGEAAGSISAEIVADGLGHAYRIQIQRELPRSVTVNGKRPTSLGGHYAALPLVLFHPGDLELATGSPAQRRAFLDRMFVQLDVNHARLLAEYDKALRSRNRLLKAASPDRRSVGAYDRILAAHGARIASARAQLVTELAPLATAHFGEIIGEERALTLEYAARHEPDAAALEKALHDTYAKDVARGFTGVGPHGDDLRVGAFQCAAKYHASQGQHRAIVLALKVAEVQLLARRTHKLPMLLLDDVSSELDRTRNRRFFGLLARMGGQVFMTTTHREFILLEEERADFRLEAGRVERVPA